VRAIPPKIQILKFVWEQGIVTVDDVTRHLFQPDKFRAVRIALHKLGVAHIKYPGIKHGIWFIDKPELYDLLSCYFPDLPSFEVRPVPVIQFLHYLEINRIRTAIQNSSQIILDEWWSENYIRVLDPAWRGRADNSIIPDAIFWRKRPDGTRQQFFLEYERTLKNRERYTDIFCYYAKREGVQNRNVIYICQTPYIRQALVSIEARLAKVGKLEGTGLYFQFVTLESFYKTYGDQPINKEILPCAPSNNGSRLPAVNVS